MTITLNERPALLIVDLQCGLAVLPFARSFDEIVQRAQGLALAFLDHGLPVVLVNNDGVAPGRREQDATSAMRAPGWSDLVVAIDSLAANLRVTKRTPGAFTGTGLDEWLRDRSVTQVVVAGVATGTGVEATARQAYEFGYDVALATDVMTDMDAAVHENSIRRIFPRIGESGTAREIVALLGRKRN